MLLHTQEKTDCWYEIGFDPKRCMLLIRIHDVFFDLISGDPYPESAEVKALGRELDLGSFKNYFSERSGFNSAIQYLPKDGRFEVLGLEIPTARKETGADCTHCKGTGVSEHSSGICLHCDGCKKQFVYVWEGIKALSASLTVLFWRLNKHDVATFCERPQLMALQTYTRDKGGSSQIVGTLSYDFCRWLERRLLSEMSQVSHVMQKAHEHMIGGRNAYSVDDFRVEVMSPMAQLVMNCPGNACQLIPSSPTAHRFEGYNIMTVHEDSMDQQIIFLVGLAVLHDMARKEMER